LLAAQGVDGAWLHLPTGVQAMRHSYGGDRNEYEAQMQRWLRAPFLVVDDLGAEIGGKDVAELVYRVADARYNDELATIWTTNLAPMTLAQSGIDPRTASRIGAGVAIELGGRDRRAK
jgi:DNA replication protein DnaC